MKAEVVASHKKIKLAAVAGVMGLGGLALCGGSVSAMSSHDSMVINPVYQKYMQDVSAGNGASWKLIPNKYIYNGEYGGKGSDLVLPSSYKIEDKYLTTLKNQGTDGNCWAFATTTVIESNLKKNEGIDVELSPKQLDYVVSSGTPYYNFLSTNFGIQRELGGGGSFVIASFPIGGQATPVTEASFFAKLQANDDSLAEYSSWRGFQDINLMNYQLSGNGETYSKAMDSSQVMASSNDYVVTKYRHYFGDTSLIETIKEDVYKYGAAYVGTTAPNFDGCWDASTKTIVDLGAEACAGGGHAMAVIGWDDNHVYTDPATGETKTGAFLLQNSWGKSSIWSDYGLNTDAIMALFNTEGAAEEDVAELRSDVQNLLDNYDALENVWLGYDFDDSAETGWVDFASVQGTKAYAYDNVYDSFNQAEGFGADEVSEESTYVFSTKNDVEYVDAISVATHAVAYNADVEYVIYLDATGTGENYKKIGSAIMPMGEMGQETVELAEPVEVSGVFKIKVEGVANGEIQSFDEKDLLLRSLAVYTVDEEIEVPNTSGAVAETTAPNTGWFTGENSFAKVGGVLVMMGVLLASLFGVRVYKNRKHLFHKIGFSKKGF